MRRGREAYLPASNPLQTPFPYLQNVYLKIEEKIFTLSFTLENNNEPFSSILTL
jgi:hypothetical protein